MEPRKRGSCGHRSDDDSKRQRLDSSTEIVGMSKNNSRKRRNGNEETDPEVHGYHVRQAGDRARKRARTSVASEGYQSASHARFKHEKKRRKSVVDFKQQSRLRSILKENVGHQVATLAKNPSLKAYLKASSSDFASVSLMMNLFDNTLFCEHEILCKQARKEVIPKLLHNRGFLEAVRYHLCQMPSKANVQERVSSTLFWFIGQLCKLFEHILSSGDVVVACDVLPVDTLWGATKQLSAQELRYKTLHGKAKVILQLRDKVRQMRYDAALEKHVLNDAIVLPSKEELELETLPISLQANIVRGPYRDELHYLEVQYQLLREDFIHPLRCALHDIESDEEEGQTVQVYNAKLDGQAYDSKISFEVPHNCKIQWDRSKRFSFGNLVCLINDAYGRIIFATVAERKVEDLEKGLLTVDFHTNVDVMRLPSEPYRMIESPGFYAAYAPVIRRLHALQKDPKSLPFTKYIVNLQTDIQCPKYVSPENGYTLNLHNTVCGKEHDEGDTCPCRAVDILDKVTWNKLPTPMLNESQKEALHSALTKELSIIQGPPGTGKTYTGLKIVEALLQNRASWDNAHKSTLVVVCYTNHALDQFLEGIINLIGKQLPQNTKVRRIGGRSKSQLMKNYNIKEFVLRHLRNRHIYGFWKKQNSKVRQMLDALKDLQHYKFNPQIVKIYASFIVSEIRQNLNPLSFVPFLVEASSGRVATWLDLSPMADLPVCYGTGEDDRKMEGEADPEDEIMEVYGKEQLCGFFQHLSNVEALTDSRASEIACFPPDEIELHVRLQLFKYFVQSAKQNLEERLKLGREGEEQYEEQKRLAMIDCLKDADLIGLTTTLAARHNGLLSEIDAKIVIVEEAAEVLESHIVSSINRKTEHLILIGDHKQLHPRTNDHTIASEYHLDISLFERLVENGLPHVTLQCQHRMRPEISHLVSSHVYDNLLRDAEKTMHYPPIAGLKHSVFFIDHSMPETTNVDLKSKTNRHEASFLARLCNYLLQQATYTEKQITVLTPYTGQLFHLRDVFQNFKMSDVKITTIDSYQGEENDITLVSLVRSEKPGFVVDKGRMCVALSRAKHGLYVIGNFSKLFVHKCKLWRSLVNSMKRHQRYGTSLPLECHGHKTLTQVSKPEDFDQVPNGGCTLSCNSRLIPCRHMCPLKCHPIPDKGAHSNIQCKEQCPRFCDRGHQCKKMCFECEGHCICYVLVEKIVPKCGHQQLIPCYLDANKYVCQESCQNILSCGHKCRGKCGEDHTVECIELVTKMCPKKHEGKAECYISNEDYSRRCEAACSEPLMCGHLCQGTCGECRQGRLHKPCKKKCGRTLTCGHICSSPCAENCPPCKEQCPVMCPHGPCDHKCYDPCHPCPYPCTRKCEHQKCFRLCGQLCDIEPCDKPCLKKLPCSHECMGMCGEICPDVCQICDREKFSEKVPIIFGTEDLDDNPELRVIMLDCGHMFECHSLHRYYHYSVEHNKIQWIQCLLCKTPVFKVNRYKHLTITIVEGFNKIKRKEALTKDERKKLEATLRESVENSQLVKYREMFSNNIHGLSDNRLQGECVVFHAEKCVNECFNDKNKQPLMILPFPHCEMGEEFTPEIETLRRQKEDFLHRLHVYRQKPLTGQVIHDIEAEQHRFQLLTVVFRIKSHIKANKIEVSASDQSELEDFLQKYGTGNGHECILKMSNSEFDSSMTYLKDLERRYEGLRGITKSERSMIIRAMKAKPGSWYQCPNGHIYNIGECGGAMVESTCPDCNATIGGTSHRLYGDNTHAGEFDGSSHAAWPIGADMHNYDLH